MNRYELLEQLECAAVRYLKRHTGPMHRMTTEMLAGFLNHLAAKWGCHYTVSAANLRSRRGRNPYGFRPR